MSLRLSVDAGQERKATGLTEKAAIAKQKGQRERNSAKPCADSAAAEWLSEIRELERGRAAVITTALGSSRIYALWVG
jgi:hypothetical protein